MKFEFDWPSGFREEVLNGGQTDLRRMQEHGNTMSSPSEPGCVGELENICRNTAKISNRF